WYNAATIAAGGLSGGISSTIAGGNFWAGARQGLITSGLNHSLHSSLSGNKYRFRFDGDNLIFEDGKGKEIFKVDANSGNGEHMNNPDSQGIKDHGPTPEGSYYLELKPGVPTERSGGGWGDFALRLNEYLNTKINNRINHGRGGFFLHEDGNAPEYIGSSGCIAIFTKADTVKVWTTLIAFQMSGYNTMDVIVN